MVLIVVPPERVDLLLRIVQRREPVYVHTFFAKPPIEGLDRGIVRRFATSTEVEDHGVRVRPQVHGGADELRPVVAVDALRQSSLEAQSLERGDDIAGRWCMNRS